MKSGLNSSTHEELREIKGLAISTAPTQSSRDSNTISISDNSATRESHPGITTGIMTDTPSTDVTAIHAEIPEELQMHPNNYRSVIPTDIQALTVLQDLVSDDFQAKNTPSTQRKREDTRSIQRFTTNSKKSNGIFKGSIRYISLRTNSTNSRQVLQSISSSTNKN